jgi:hypothetical protein
MTGAIAIALLVVALILAGAEVIDSHGRSFAGWAAFIIAIVLLFERLG